MFVQLQVGEWLEHTSLLGHISESNQGKNRDVHFCCSSKSPAGLQDVQLLTWHFTLWAWMRAHYFSLMVIKSIESFFFRGAPERPCKCYTATKHLPLDYRSCRMPTSSSRLPQYNHWNELEISVDIWKCAFNWLHPQISISFDLLWKGSHQA